MRPLGLSLHPIENVITLQYSIQRSSGTDGTDEFETKELRMKIPSITKNTDIHLLAQKILKAKRIIPPPWISQIEDYLVEIGNRHSLNNGKINQTDNAIERKEQEIEQIYNEFYDINEERRIMASRKLFELCLEVENIEVVEKNYQLISMLSRILKDRANCSAQLLLYVIKVFAVLSGFEYLHPVLAEYQVGSSVLDLFEIESKAQMSEESDSANDRRKQIIACTCICILLNLADDLVVRIKIMKRGIFAFLKTFVMHDQPNRSKWMAISLLYRLSIIGETSEIFSDPAESKLLQYLTSALNENFIELSDLIPRILFNLSFNKKCRQKMYDDKIQYSVTKLINSHDISEPALQLLYNLSLDQTFHTQFDANHDLLQRLTYLIASEKGPNSSMISAILANLSILPRWAESLVTHIGLLLDRVRTEEDFSSSVILFNLSKWTYNIQEVIRKAVGDVESSACYAKQSNSKMGIKDQYWGDNVHTVISTFVSSIHKNTEIAVQMARILSYFTNHDLPINSSWSDLDSIHSLFHTFYRYSSSNQCDLVLIGAICSVLKNIAIESKADALSLSDGILLESLCHRGCHRNGRTHQILQRELISLIHSLLLESEYSELVSSFEDLFIEEIYVASQTGSSLTESIALSCLDHIIFQRDKFKEMSIRAVDIRFRIWNSKWIDKKLTK